jgi:ribosomal-protein-alanine N-acetyltransferase
MMCKEKWNPTEEVTVCPVKREHLPKIASLEQLCFSEPWSEKALELLLEENAAGAVCLLGDEVMAYAGVLFVPGEGQITNVAVHPDARRRGYGRAVLSLLLEEALQREDCEQISLEVRVSNVSAIGLYESMGFETVGLRKRFYRSPVEDALVKIKTLTPKPHP